MKNSSREDAKARKGMEKGLMKDQSSAGAQPLLYWHLQEIGSLKIRPPAFGECFTRKAKRQPFFLLHSQFSNHNSPFSILNSQITPQLYRMMIEVPTGGGSYSIKRTGSVAEPYSRK